MKKNRVRKSRDTASLSARKAEPRVLLVYVRLPVCVQGGRIKIHNKKENNYTHYTADRGRVKTENRRHAMEDRIKCASEMHFVLL